MTISTSVGREFQVGALIDTAYKLAGLLNSAQVASVQQKAFGRTLLETVLDGIQGEGVSARARGFEVVSLTEGEFKCSLPATVQEVIGVGMYIPASESDLDRANGETPVMSVSAEQWQTISAKGVESRPTMYYPYRAVSPVQVWLWPIPSEAGSIRFQVHRLLADVDVDTATLDLERYWDQYVLWELAHQLAAASSLPINRLGYYSAQAEKKKVYAKSMGRANSGGQLRVVHRTRWS